MTALLYKNYVLISRPRYDEKLRRWVPYASAIWDDDPEFRYRQFKDFAKTFETEEEALSFGFVVAETSIKEER